jgi:hypothetical protein
VPVAVFATTASAVRFSAMMLSRECWM